MSPVPPFAPPPPAVANLIQEITEAWQLDDILDALPRGLNPYRTKNVMKWGVDFITRLRDLAVLTVGDHEEVVTALMERAGQPVTAARPDVKMPRGEQFLDFRGCVLCVVQLLRGLPRV
jgi:hypothetical protein